MTWGSRDAACEAVGHTRGEARSVRVAGPRNRMDRRRRIVYDAVMRSVWCLVVALALGCSGAPSVAADGGGRDVSIASDAVEDGAAVDAAVDAATPRDADVVTGLRGQRYCEVLAGTISGAVVQVDVYNTIGLNECPDGPWRALDVAALRAQLGVPIIVLNGPRHWLLDVFETASLQSATVRDVGGIAMRVAGRVELPLSAAAAGVTPYRTQTVRRDTTVRFEAGARVYELIDDASAVYVMQSYSLQVQAQTLASLETLGERLHLPTGWRFRTRVLTEPLRVTAVDGYATVVPDDFSNTYQRTQLTP